MEFDTIGQHCAVSDCRQKDFLPFTCDYCRKKLCNEHRAYAAHSCDGAKAKDITSIDCPVCAKSVKFDKSQDVNTVWEAHHLNECSQIAVDPKKKPPKKSCARLGCRTVLGISNTYTCPKCQKLVCLSHRIPEEHNCASNVAAAKKTVSNHWSNKAMTSSSSSSRSALPVKPKGKAKSSYTSKEDMASILRETAHRRKQGGATETTTTTTAAADVISHVPVGSGSSSEEGIPSIACPLCTFKDLELEVVSRHMANMHPQYQGTIDTSAPAGVGGGGGAYTGEGQEVCPMCNQRFSDTFELISHCEIVHSDNGNTGNSGSGSSSGSSASGNRFKENCYIA